MKILLPKEYYSKIMRAIIEFDLIDNDDRILIGLSGGKDSLFLTYALAFLKQHLRKNFTLGAITINPLFSSDFNVAPLASFCDELDIPFYTQEVDIAGTIESQQGKDPCFTCAFFRRGAINSFARENNYNKIAYALHNDDAVETFFMSLLYSGQLKTFLPKTYLDRTDLTVIRPLVYFREFELADTAKIHGLKPIPSPCPINGKTKRQEIKDLIKTLETNTPDLYAHLAAGMRENSVIELWPANINRHLMKQKHTDFMKNR